MLAFLKGEIVRAIELLGKIKGSMQNEMDIYTWCKDGVISIGEASLLKKFNSDLAEI